MKDYALEMLKLYKKHKIKFYENSAINKFYEERKDSYIYRYYFKTIKELDEKNYIDGYNLDVDKLLYNEILIGWPMKVLCSEDCKGICNTCGQNLNKGTCNCEDTSLDPRMSVIRDVFKNFKEV